VLATLTMVPVPAPLSFTSCCSGDGGAATLASMNRPWSCAHDQATGTVYVTVSVFDQRDGTSFVGLEILCLFQEINNCIVRKLNSSGSIGTLAGNGSCLYAGDGAVFV